MATGNRQSPSRPQTGRFGQFLRRTPRAATLAPVDISNAVVDGVELPICSDWGWRPELWSASVTDGPVALEGSGMRIGHEMAVFHDADSDAVQTFVSQESTDGAAAQSVTLDVGAFAGSFLSLVLDLPTEGVSGLKQRHLVGLSIDLERAPGQEVFARFNLRHGPNTEQLLRGIPFAEQGESRQVVEFDLAYIEINEKRVESAWIDLILENPAGSPIKIHDLVLYRRPRAEL